jgi:flagellar export protein FliJ
MKSMKKIKRVQPIIKMKQTRVDNEAAILAEINKAKVQAVAAMRDSQRQYMTGVDELNRIRTSSKRDNIDTIESGLDHVKAQWYAFYRKVQELENKERAQIARLNEAERELKAIERLQERYTMDFKKEVGKAEQKMLDEIALRQFVSQSKS